MPIRKAISESDTGCCSREGEIWRAEGDNFRMLHINNKHELLFTEENTESIEREYEGRGIKLRPLNR
jgi:hypothetical protein